MQKFETLKYDTSKDSTAEVQQHIQQQITAFNNESNQLYESYLQQRETEATTEEKLSQDGSEVTISYKDAANQTFKTETKSADLQTLKTFVALNLTTATKLPVGNLQNMR